jgi:TonB family protein
MSPLTLRIIGAVAVMTVALLLVIQSPRPLVVVGAIAVGGLCVFLLRGALGEGGAAGRGRVEVVPPRLVSGSVTPEDWPAGPWFDRLDGAVLVSFVVDRDGSPRQVAVARSSGIADLDARSCELVAERFRYTPAVDASGEPVEHPFEQRICWDLAALEGTQAGVDPERPT